PETNTLLPPNDKEFNEKFVRIFENNWPLDLGTTLSYIPNDTQLTITPPTDVINGEKYFSVLKGFTRLIFNKFISRFAEPEQYQEALKTTRSNYLIEINPSTGKPQWVTYQEKLTNFKGALYDIYIEFKNYFFSLLDDKIKKEERETV